MNTPAEDFASHADSDLEKFESLWESTPKPDVDEFLKSHGLTDLGTDEQESLLVAILSIDLERRVRLLPQRENIKPSNVLVSQESGESLVKVIDFGLAKALQATNRLSDKSMFTEFGQVMGTLQWMCPEHAEMNALDVDTRSDVYLSGVLLYELLTGSTPLESVHIHFGIPPALRERDDLRFNAELFELLTGIPTTGIALLKGLNLPEVSTDQKLTPQQRDALAEPGRVASERLSAILNRIGTGPMESDGSMP